jgi:predicted nuclease of predicted toxin-antitoxin system
VRWLADECVAATVVARLRMAGHEVAYAAEISPAASDTDAISFAHHENRLLLTEDKDFGELVFRWNGEVPGLVLIRIDPQKNLLKWERLNAAIER